MERLLTVTTATCAALALAACAGQAGGTGTTAPAEEPDYRVSVEIPLDELHVAEGEILRVNELLDERTDFDAEDFLLDEVVVVARSNGDVEASAELLVVEWRSGQVAIPAGEGDEWYEVRVPAPGEDLGGAWLLDIAGDATVDLVVAVLQPQPRRVAEARTVYRTTTVYRSSPVREVFWIYDPARYYVVHYHGAWPYRYFIGPWSYRYYDLAYRPHRYHYGPIYRPWNWRDDARAYRYGRPADRRRGDRPAVQPPRSQAAPRRIAPSLVQLRRAHPRLRTLPRADVDRRPATRPGRGQTSLADDARRAAASRQLERRPIQRAATSRAERSPSSSRTLRQRSAPRPPTAAAQRETARSPTRTRAPARTATGQRASATRSTAPRARTAAPTARRFERSPSRSVPQATRNETARRGAAAAAPRSRASGDRRSEVRRATGVRPVRNVQPRRAAPRQSANRSERNARPARSIQPQRHTRPAAAAQPQRSVERRAAQPRRPATRAPAPVRRDAARASRGRSQAAPSQPRPQPSAQRSQPTRQPARTAREARAADERPPADNGRGRRFERR